MSVGITKSTMILNNRQKLSSLILSFTVMLTVISACDKPIQKDVLAQIENFKVTEVHFENAFKEYYYRTGQVLSPDERTKLSVLNTTFNTYVLATFAEDEGLDKTQAALYKKEEIKARVLTEEYLNQVVLADIKVLPEEVNEYFVRFNTTLSASHLYAQDLESANALYSRLQSGERFEDLANEVFQNPYLAKNGGDIGSFTTDDMDIAFENAAFGLKVGEISNPVQTAQGYSIIKLTNRFTKPILTEYELAVKKPQIEGYVLKKKQELTMRARMNEFINSIYISEEALFRIWNQFNENYEGAISKSPEFLENLKSDEEFATYRDFKFEMEDFISELSITPTQYINTINSPKMLRNFVLGTAYRAYMVQKAEENGIDKQALVKESIAETYYHYLADEASAHLKSTITNTDQELRVVFNENKARFEKPMLINLQRIVVDNEEEANQIIKNLEKGASFKALVKKHSINNEDLFTDGELGYESIKSYGFMSTKLANLNVGDISEVIHYETGKYHIYKCLGIEEAIGVNFEEARDQVNNFLTTRKLKSLRASTIEDVKKKHDAVIDTQKLKELTIQI